MKNVDRKMLFASILGCSMFLTGILSAADAPQGSANPLGGFFPLIIIFVIFYFFLIRPQQKKAKEHQNLVNALKKDDKIITSGGLYGTVTAVKGDVVEVKIAENVKVQIAKTAISTVIGPEVTEAVTPEVVK
jgi:preprotein translocase subunit YajC